MIEEEEAFVVALLQDPSDDITRRVYTDWCDENGRPEQARYLRSIRRCKFVRRVRAWPYENDPFTGERPTLGDVGLVTRFADYYEDNPAWGVLHTVLDDGNVDDESVRFCIDYAPPIHQTMIESELERGRELARLLLRMTKTQRGRLPELCRVQLSAMARNASR